VKVIRRGSAADRLHHNNTAMQTLEDLPKRLHAKRIFPLNRSQATVAVSRLVRSIGIEDFRFHDLRHTYASLRAIKGRSSDELASSLGHTTPRRTQRYAHLSDQHRREIAADVEIGPTTPRLEAK
jgi:integrase